MSDRVPTLADVCSAIAEGHIAAVVDGSMYQINALELRRYLNKLRSLPSISITVAQTPRHVLTHQSGLSQPIHP